MNDNYCILYRLNGHPDVRSMTYEKKIHAVDTARRWTAHHPEFVEIVAVSRWNGEKWVEMAY